MQKKSSLFVSQETIPVVNGHLLVNGLNIYYEVHGQPEMIPLVLIHGGGSTIDSSFGHILPLLAKYRQVIALELQAHGRTGDRDGDLSFEQDAADIAGLLSRLGITKADLFGFSNGGQTALQMALSFPGVVSP